MDPKAVMPLVDKAILNFKDLPSAWNDLIALCRAQSGGEAPFWDDVAGKGCADDLSALKQWLADAFGKAAPPAGIGAVAFIPDSDFIAVQLEGHESWDGCIDHWNWPSAAPYRAPGDFRPAVSGDEIKRIWAAQSADPKRASESPAEAALFTPFAPLYMVNLILAAVSELDPQSLTAVGAERTLLFTIPGAQNIFLLGKVGSGGFRKAEKADFDKLTATDNWHERKGALPHGEAPKTDNEPSFMSIKPAKPEPTAVEMASPIGGTAPNPIPDKPRAKGSKPAPAKKAAAAKKPAAKKAAPPKAAPKKSAASKSAPAAKKKAAKKAKPAPKAKPAKAAPKSEKKPPAKKAAAKAAAKPKGKPAKGKAGKKK